MRAWIQSGRYVACWPIAFLAVIAAVDSLLLGASWLPLHGLADEVSNVLTAGIWIGAVQKVGLPVAIVPGMVAAVIIDLDHLPDILGWFAPPEGTSRPVTHSLGVVVVAAAVALIWPARREVMAGVAMGLLAHLVRDLGTGTVLFWWPLSADRVSMPYLLSFAITSGLAVIACLPGLPKTAGDGCAAPFHPGRPLPGDRESVIREVSGVSSGTLSLGTGASQGERNPERFEAVIAPARMSPLVEDERHAKGHRVGGRRVDAR